jgi:uncharacterized protein with PIN domain
MSEEEAPPVEVENLRIVGFDVYFASVKTDDPQLQITAVDPNGFYVDQVVITDVRDVAAGIKKLKKAINKRKRSMNT